MKKPPHPSKLYKFDTVPDGWFTRTELENHWNLSQARTIYLIRMALQNKTAKHKRFRIKTPRGIPYPVPHYLFL
jgi:hypothetical protein